MNNFFKARQRNVQTRVQIRFDGNGGMIGDEGRRGNCCDVAIKWEKFDDRKSCAIKEFKGT